MSSYNTTGWTEKYINEVSIDSLQLGKTYLSVYSQIYSLSEKVTIDLTATISMRNTSTADSIYITKAEYFNTKGNLIRRYFEKPIFLLPLETIDIVIDEKDKEGGTGANFIIEWKIRKHVNEPLFEAIMISTSGQRKVSFVTQGKKIN
jgi:hypothetical protein